MATGYARYSQAVYAAECRIASAREAVNAAATEVKERGHAYAGPSIATAWTLFGNAHRSAAYAAELADYLGIRHPQNLEKECGEIWETLRAADGVKIS